MNADFLSDMEHEQRYFNHIAARVREVRDRIAEAAKKSGRSGDDVTLVAVTKYVEPGNEIHDAFLAAGCRDLGESRPQSLIEKAEHLAGQSVRWHMIGSLQRNKVRKILPITSLIHSLDSVTLAEAIDRIAEEENLPPVDVLVEVAISGEETKHGFTPTEIPAVLDNLFRLKHLSIKGLMCMAGLHADNTETHRQFEAVRKLAEPFSLPELSMGMSDDFEIAVEEGATLVRVGSRLYR